MNRIYQEATYPRLVWQDGNALLDASEMERLMRMSGETYIGIPPSEPVMANVYDTQGALAAFRLAFPNHSFYGVGPDYPPPFEPIDIREEVVY